MEVAVASALKKLKLPEGHHTSDGLLGGLHGAEPPTRPARDDAPTPAPSADR